MGVLLSVASLLLVAVVVLLVLLLRRLSMPGLSPEDPKPSPAKRAGQPVLTQSAAQTPATSQADTDADAEKVRREAAQTAHAVTDRLRTQVEVELGGLREELKGVRTELERRELRLGERETRADDEQERLAIAMSDLLALRSALDDARTSLADLQLERARVLEKAASLSRDEAKAELVAVIEQQAKREAALTVRDIEAEAREHGETRARAIVADAVQRVASEQTSESVVTVLHLPSEEMKGRIIGREGRNIRSFESVTGVNVVIDDTPEAVLLSCFDPVRREVGRLTMEKLILDGRIHPHRIEEVHERAKAEVAASCRRAGEDALVQVGMTDVHPDLLDLLGRLKLRTSYGQNVLKHLIETAHIASHMASELGVDPALVKRGAFFHDIGKALTHEVEGSHALIGADLARRYGERDEVVHAIAAHHGEVAPETIEAVLTQASDSCSGGRPGARRESLESYVQRLQRIEEIASCRPGVERVFAMQAGREVRVMVVPEEVDDLGALVLAREVAKQIEDELTYPGQIRVTVVRESRAIEIAH